MIDLTRYCADENEIRAYLQHPWREKGTIVASNGHIAIEIPDDGREVPTVVGKPPDIAKLLSRPSKGDFSPMPELAPFKSTVLACARCKGDGFHFAVACDECEDGRFDHGSHWYDCAECNATGSVGDEDKSTRCLLCSGFGEPARNGHETDIGAATFATRYLRAFASLPNVQIAVGGKDDMASIRFDGGRGAVMPIRK